MVFYRTVRNASGFTMSVGQNPGQRSTSVGDPAANQMTGKIFSVRAADLFHQLLQLRLQDGNGVIAA